MNLIRKYKIYKSFNIIDNETKEIFNFVENSLLNLIEIKIEKYENYKFYFNSNKCVLKHPINSKIIYVEYENITKIIENKYDLKYETISDFFKYLINKTYELNIEEIVSYS